MHVVMDGSPVNVGKSLYILFSQQPISKRKLKRSTFQCLLSSDVMAIFNKIGTFYSFHVPLTGVRFQKEKHGQVSV